MNDLEIVVATQEYIKTHYNNADFSIETICNAIGYSRRQLDRLFHKFLQTSGYEPTYEMDIEAYTEGNMGSPDYRSEIWVPVFKK